MEPDAELLHRFAANADEAAFRMLVERHSGMVYGVALRASGDASMAEEIAQRVFTILAGKARGLAHKKLSGWLHDAAVLEARNFARKAARYRRVVSAYQNEMTPSSENASWENVSPHLDEALSRLPERAKSMLIMRFYERLSFREIAGMFGKSEEASRKEVDRSVQHLGALLKKRGILTTGAALSAMLAAQTLCVSPASAAALATASLRALPLGALPFLERAAEWGRAAFDARKTIAVAVVALTPAAFLWARNLQLEDRIRVLTKERERIVHVAVPPGNVVVSQTPEEPPVPPAAAQPQHTQAKAMEQAREQAALELQRIGLNIPDLSADQKSRIQAILEQRRGDKLAAKMDAFESGAMRRYAVNPDEASGEDKALLFAMEPPKVLPFQDEEVKAVLSPEQFAEYVRTEEAKRVSDAEAAASDVLKAVGLSLDLDPERKDEVFQALARLELTGPSLTSEEREKPFGERDAMEAARDEIVLAHLTPEQAEVYAKFREEHKARMVGFLKTMGPKEEAK